MESSRPTRLPAAAAASRERDRLEIAAAIALVAGHAATRVIVVGLQDPALIAAAGLAEAQAAGVRFALIRDSATGAISVAIGPLEA